MQQVTGRQLRNGDISLEDLDLDLQGSKQKADTALQAIKVAPGMSASRVGNELEIAVTLIKAGQLDLSEMSSFKAYAATSQTIQPGVRTKLRFQNELFDQQNEYDAANSRWRAGAKGVYAVSAQVPWDAGSANKEFGLILYRNGAPYASMYRVTAVRGTAAFTLIMRFEAGDTVEIYALASSTTLCSSLESANDFAFSIIKIL